MDDHKNAYLELTVGKIVARDYRKALVFKKHGIDFCCGGKISVAQAAEEAGVPLDTILNELELLDQSGPEIQDFDTWPLDKLVDFILEKHHVYVKTTIVQLTPMLEKVVKVHSGWRPELTEVNDVFYALARELTCHMYKEEEVLFPLIRKRATGEDLTSTSIEHPVKAMEHEHDIAGQLMQKIKDLTENYTPPSGACATYIVVYKVLKEFEMDLHQHIHLENNILFPKAAQLNKT